MGNQHSGGGHRARSARRRSSDRGGETLSATRVHRDGHPSTTPDRGLPVSVTTRRGRSTSSAGVSQPPLRPHTSHLISSTIHFSETASGAAAGTRTTAAPLGRPSSQAFAISSLTTAAAVNRQLTSSSPERQTLRGHEGEEGNDDASLNADRSAQSVSCAPSSTRAPNATAVSADEAPSCLTSEAGVSSIPMGFNAAAAHVLHTARTTTDAAAAAAAAAKPSAAVRGAAASDSDDQNVCSSSSSQGANAVAAESKPSLGRTQASSSQPAAEPPSPLIVRSSRQTSIAAARVVVAGDGRARPRPHSPSPEARPPPSRTSEGASASKKTTSRKEKGGVGAGDSEGTEAPPPPKHPNRTMGSLLNPRKGASVLRRFFMSSAERESRTKSKEDASPSPTRTDDGGARASAETKCHKPEVGDVAAVASPIAAASALTETHVGESDVHLGGDRRKATADEIPCPAPPSVVAATSKAKPTSAIIASDSRSGSGGIAVRGADSLQPTGADSKCQSGFVARKSETARVTPASQSSEVTEGEGEGGEGLWMGHSSSERALDSNASPASLTTANAECGLPNAQRRDMPFAPEDEGREELEEATAPTVVEQPHEGQPSPRASAARSDHSDHGEDDHSTNSDRDGGSQSTTSTDTNSAPILPPPPTASFAEAMWGIQAAAFNTLSSHSRDAHLPAGGAAVAGTGALSASDSSIGPNSSPIYSPRIYFSRHGRGGAVSGATTVTDTTARVSPRSPRVSPPLHSMGSTGCSNHHSLIHFVSTTDADAGAKRRKSVSQSAVIAAWNRMGARSGALVASSTSAIAAVGGKMHSPTSVNANISSAEESSVVSAVAVAGGASDSATAPQIPADTSDALAEDRPATISSPVASSRQQTVEKFTRATAQPESTVVCTGEGDAASWPRTHAASGHHCTPLLPVRRCSVLTRQRGHPMFCPTSPSPSLSPKDPERQKSVELQPSSHVVGPYPRETAAAVAGALYESVEAFLPAALLEKAELPSTEGERHRGVAHSPKGGSGTGGRTPCAAAYTLPTFFTQEEKLAKEAEGPGGAAAASLTSPPRTAENIDNTKLKGERGGSEAHKERCAAHEALPSRASTMRPAHSRMLSGLADLAEGSGASTPANACIQHTSKGDAEDMDDRLYCAVMQAGAALKQGDDEVGGWTSPRRSPSSSLPLSCRQPGRRPSAVGGLTMARAARSASVTAVTLGPQPLQTRRALSDISPFADAATSPQRSHHYDHLPRQANSNEGLVWSNPSSSRSTEIAPPLSGLRNRCAGQRHGDVEEEEGDVEVADVVGVSRRRHDRPWSKYDEDVNVESDEGFNSARSPDAAADMGEPALFLSEPQPLGQQRTAMAAASRAQEDNDNSSSSSMSCPNERIAFPRGLAHASCSGSIRSTEPVTADAVLRSGGMQPARACTKQPPQQALIESSAFLRSFSAACGNSGASTTHHRTHTNVSNGGAESGDNRSLADSRRRRLSSASQGPPPLAQHPSPPQPMQSELSGSGVQWNEVSLVTSGVGTPRAGTTGLNSREEVQRGHCPLQRHDYVQYDPRKDEDEDEDTEAEELQRLRQREDSGDDFDVVLPGEDGGGGETCWSEGNSQPFVSWFAELPQAWQRMGEEEEEEVELDEEEGDTDHRDDARSHDAVRRVGHRHVRCGKQYVRHIDDGVGGRREANSGRHSFYRRFSFQGVSQLCYVGPPPESDFIFTSTEDQSQRSDAGRPFHGSTNSSCGATAFLPLSACDQDLIHTRAYTAPLADNAIRLPRTHYEPPMPSNRNAFTAFISLADVSSHLLAFTTNILHGGHPQDGKDNSSKSTSGAAINGSGGSTTTTTENGFSTGNTLVTADTLPVTDCGEPRMHKPIRSRSGHDGGSTNGGAADGGNGGGGAAMDSIQLSSPLFSSVSTAPTNCVSNRCSPVQASLPLAAEPTTPRSGKVGGSGREQSPKAVLPARGGKGAPVMQQQQQSGLKTGDKTSTIALPQKRRANAAAATMVTASLSPSLHTPARLPNVGGSVTAELATAAAAPVAAAAALAPIIIQKHQQQAPEGAKAASAEAAVSVAPTGLSTTSPTEHVLPHAEHASNLLLSPTIAAKARSVSPIGDTVPPMTTAMIADAIMSAASSGDSSTSAAAGRSRGDSGFQSSSDEGEDLSGADGGGGGVLLLERQDTTAQSEGDDSDCGIRRHASAKTLATLQLMPVPTAIVRTNSEPLLTCQTHRGCSLHLKQSPELPWWNRARVARSEGSGFLAERRETLRGGSDEGSGGRRRLVNSPRSQRKSSPRLRSAALQQSGAGCDAAAVGRDAELQYAIASMDESEAHTMVNSAGSYRGTDREEDRVCREDVEAAVHHSKSREHSRGRRKSGGALYPLHVKSIQPFDFEEDANATEDECDANDGRLDDMYMRTATWGLCSSRSSSSTSDTKLASAHAAPTSVCAPRRTSNFGAAPVFTVVVPPTPSFLEEADRAALHHSDDNREEKTFEDEVGVRGDTLNWSGGSSTATAVAFVACLDTLVDSETYTRACIHESAMDVLGTWRSVWSALQLKASMASPVPFSETLAPLLSSTADGAAVTAGGEVRAQLATSPTTSVLSGALTRLSSVPHSPSGTVPLLMNAVAVGTAAAEMERSVNSTTVRAPALEGGGDEGVSGGGQAGDAGAVVSRVPAPLQAVAVPVPVPADEEQRDLLGCFPSSQATPAVAGVSALHPGSTAEEGEAGVEDDAAASSPLSAAELPHLQAQETSWSAGTAATPNAQYTGDQETPSYFLFGPSTTSGRTLNNTSLTSAVEGAWSGAAAIAPGTVERSGDVGGQEGAQQTIFLVLQRKQGIDGDGGEEGSATSRPVGAPNGVNAGERERGRIAAARSALPPPTPPSSPVSRNGGAATTMRPTAGVPSSALRDSPDPLPLQAPGGAFNHRNGNVAITAEAFPSSINEGDGRGSRDSSSSRHPHHLHAPRRTSSSPRSPYPRASSAASSSPWPQGRRSHSAQQKSSMGQVMCRCCGAPYTSTAVCPVARRFHELLRRERKREKIAKRQAQALLCEGRIAEAVALLEEVGVYVP
ncbi:hypothetical protein ABL78_1849 [Leptomonas seymouri]|uniref:Uncharacterized protein n=1 Tax=Leptomonas seymouri TaxID=5684 RepID=A0A0N0P7Q1_LEPSE|nr:hypothetical protein ABL78_1849 [Leptomonas seymouri]|eukprot:KPI89036.1 hypothetical protein ABL78_1849 [Leptomonas seymouri]